MNKCEHDFQLKGIQASAYGSSGLAPQCNFSTSLENLDPSAKEFLVDAGVVLDKILPPGKTLGKIFQYFFLCILLLPTSIGRHEYELSYIII